MFFFVIHILAHVNFSDRPTLRVRVSVSAGIGRFGEIPVSADIGVSVGGK